MWTSESESLWKSKARGHSRSDMDVWEGRRRIDTVVWITAAGTRHTAQRA